MSINVTEKSFKSQILTTKKKTIEEEEDEEEEEKFKVAQSTFLYNLLQHVGDQKIYCSHFTFQPTIQISHEP
jgi:neutral trehalase